MTWHDTSFLIPLVSVGLLGTAIAIFAWHRHIPGATPLALLALAAAVWSLGYAAWHRVTAWGRLAEVVNQYMGTGKRVRVGWSIKARTTRPRASCARAR